MIITLSICTTFTETSLQVSKYIDCNLLLENNPIINYMGNLHANRTGPCSMQCTWRMMFSSCTDIYGGWEGAFPIWIGAPCTLCILVPRLLSAICDSGKKRRVLMATVNENVQSISIWTFPICISCVFSSKTAFFFFFFFFFFTIREGDMCADGSENIC